MSPRRRRASAFVALLALAVGSAAAAAGCSQRSAPGVAVDEPLVAYLSRARAAHHLASVRESGGDDPGAARALEELVAAPVPGDYPEVTEVLADTHARLAELAVRRGALDEGATHVRRGLDRARDEGYFRGHLLEVSGLVDEARAAGLADAGRAGEAAEARARAMASLEAAIAMQEKVVARALDGGRPEGGAP